ncbi:hypothetical protein Nepgr_005177 [Nepenthes gracilis]|uniref:Uncharacterized protein n=1 Tax=Nepenthes gracilis TaxID=150966 RepID=A0AAD3S2T5_NEPGR|nr:hypothetical protein Nepgr_005177 [Nepenthes gracilis]
MAVKKGEVGLLTIAPEYAFCSSGFQHELAVGPHNSTIYYEAKQFEACSTLLHVKSSVATTSKVEFHPIQRVARLNLSTILNRLSDVVCDTKPTTTTRNPARMSCANYKRNECFGVLTADSADFGLGNKADPFVGSIPWVNGWSLNVQHAVLYVFQVWIALMLVAKTADKLNHQDIASAGIAHRTSNVIELLQSPYFYRNVKTRLK